MTVAQIQSAEQLKVREGFMKSAVGGLSRSALAVALMIAAAANAQVNVGATETEPTPGTLAVQNDTPDPVAAEGPGIQDIVVTAQRRAENVQRASLSIAAISADTLVERGVVDAQSLNNVVPGLKIGYTGAQVQTYVRGVGDLASNAFTQSSVALNIDGVYVARSSAFGPVFFDVARVEVLRGPQGTLYGRNASGGAINIISNAPTFAETSGYGVLEVGNYDLVRGQAVVNLPVSETFAVRGAVQLTHRDGYLSDGGNDDKSQAGRLMALWKLSDDVTLALKAEFAHIGGYGPVRVYRPANTVFFNDPWTGPQDPRINATAFPNLARRNRAGNRNLNSINTDYHGVQAQLDWDVGDVTLTVIPAYRYIDVDAALNGDAPFFEDDHSIQKNLEIRLSGSSSRLKWVLGAYAFREDLSVDIIQDGRLERNLVGVVTTQDHRKFDTEAAAVFGEATLSLTDRFRVIGGLRYTKESLHRISTFVPTPWAVPAGSPPGTLAVPGAPGPATTVDGKLKDDAITWRAGAEFDAGERNMLFATVSRGFKSGGFSAASAVSFRPEFLTAYTVGSKNRFFDNKVQLNLEGFYWKYKDQQISFLGVDDFGNSSFISRNAGNATIYGASVDLVVRPTQADTLTIGAEYLHTKYDDFRFARVIPAGVLPPAGTLLDTGCTSGGPITSSTNPRDITEDCSGFRMIRAPRWTLNSRYTHSFDLANGGEVVAGISASYTSLTFLGFNYRSPNFRQKAHGVMDLDLAYNAPNKRWSAQAYVRNVTDKAVYTAASNEVSIFGPANPDTRGSVAAIQPPRTYGVRVQYNF